MLVDELATLGFGFIEIGTVTPLPQSGNPKPRLFRLKKDQALLNRMGFNNHGADVIASRLSSRKSDILIGANIGKNKNTPNEQAISDYEICFEKLFDVVDFFVINVSSPNTEGLRSLQDKVPLQALLNHIMKLNMAKDIPKPVLLKIAPDLSESQLDDIIHIVLSEKISGLIATNTTISQNNLNTSKQKLQKLGSGGISGLPLKNRSSEVIRYIRNKSVGKIKVIGVGGILDAEDAIEKISSGASLVELYTGLIYSGPGLVASINKKLINSNNT